MSSLFSRKHSDGTYRCFFWQLTDLGLFLFVIHGPLVARFGSSWFRSRTDIWWETLKQQQFFPFLGQCSVPERPRSAASWLHVLKCVSVQKAAGSLHVILFTTFTRVLLQQVIHSKTEINVNYFWLPGTFCERTGSQTAPVWSFLGIKLLTEFVSSLMGFDGVAVAAFRPVYLLTYLQWRIKAQILSSASCWLAPLSACMSSDCGLRKGLWFNQSDRDSAGEL